MVAVALVVGVAFVSYENLSVVTTMILAGFRHLQGRKNVGRDEL